MQGITIRSQRSPSTQLLLLLCLSCVFLFSLDDRSGHIVVWAQHDHPSSATLELKTGLNFSLYHMLTSPHAPPVIPASDAYFLPILSSPSFNSSNSSLSPPGFSFGFWFKGYNGDILLALCGGLSGNNQNLTGEHYLNIAGWADGSLYVTASVVRDGYIVAPVWFASHTSVSSANASLQVVDASNVNSKQLQLVDYNGTVFWNVSNVELLEIHDSGVLTIYNTSTKTHAVWQSSRDTLFMGEKLGVGSQLTSRDSTYSARVEQGGLVLRWDAFDFMDQRPAPYWAIPAILNLAVDDILNVSAKVLSPPCHPNSTYVEVRPYYNNCALALVPGPCVDAGASTILHGESFGISAEESRDCGTLSFLRLETDGRLVNYAASHLVLDADRNVSTMTIPSSPPPVAFAMYNGMGGIAVDLRSTIMSIFDSCALPNACGPLGVCAGSWYCNCPLGPPDQIPSIVPIDPNARRKVASASNPCLLAPMSARMSTPQITLRSTIRPAFFFSVVGTFILFRGKIKSFACIHAPQTAPVTAFSIKSIPPHVSFFLMR